MSYLLDSNILLRYLQRSDPDHGQIRSSLRELIGRGDELCYTSQNIGEFWNICTRPSTSQGGYGLGLDETYRRVRLIERSYTLLPATPDIHFEWRRLLIENSVSGIAVHDARLVATMLVHRVTHILTLNDKDFKRYAGITVVHPRDV